MLFWDVGEDDPRRVGEAVMGRAKRKMVNGSGAKCCGMCSEFEKGQGLCWRQEYGFSNK